MPEFLRAGHENPDPSLMEPIQDDTTGPTSNESEPTTETRDVLDDFIWPWGKP